MSRNIVDNEMIEKIGHVNKISNRLIATTLILDKKNINKISAYT